ncbi:MAG: phosphatidate cytidylyltransferase [Salaquimonas sp.]|nr:phosphatidate cytidylyltransferase [Salaquimonas sp.]
MSDGPSRQGGPPELVLRVISALVLIAIVLALTWQGGLAFALLCAAGAALVLYEYLSMVKPALPPGTFWAAAGGYGFMLAAWFGVNPMAAALWSAFVLVVLAGADLWRKRQLWGAAGLAYAVLPFMALASTRGSELIGLHAVFLIFACVWGADTAAYFAGRAIGGPKLAPAISPNKTWAGFFGGIAGSIIAASAILYLSGYVLSATAVMLFVALSIVSQMGDLLESWIKRRFGKKDSGHIIPGHGGMLDRIDGLITTSVAAWLAGSLVSGVALVPGGAARGLFAAFILP